METDTAQSARKIDQVLDLWQRYQPLVTLERQLDSGDSSLVTVTGLSGSSSAFMLKSLVSNGRGPILAVTRDAESSGDLYDDLVCLIGEERVGHFPARQILPYDFRAPVGEIMGRRISTLAAILDKSLSVIVCPVRAILEPTLTVDQLKSNTLCLKCGEEADLDAIVEQLMKLGFRRVPNVEEVGDFALRGGLIDFFSPGAEAPIRVELFGDEIDTIRQFDVASQRTIGRTDEVRLYPKREIPINDSYGGDLPATLWTELPAHSSCRPSSNTLI